MRTPDDGAVSLSTWASEDAARAAVEQGAAWVRETMGGDVLSADTYVGPVAFDEHAP